VFVVLSTVGLRRPSPDLAYTATAEHVAACQSTAQQQTAEVSGCCDVSCARWECEQSGGNLLERCVWCWWLHIKTAWMCAASMAGAVAAVMCRLLHAQSDSYALSQNNKAVGCACTCAAFVVLFERATAGYS
jgi:hypothetical protein